MLGLLNQTHLLNFSFIRHLNQICIIIIRLSSSLFYRYLNAFSIQFTLLLITLSFIHIIKLSFPNNLIRYFFSSLLSSLLHHNLWNVLFYYMCNLLLLRLVSLIFNNLVLIFLFRLNLNLLV